MPTTPNANTTRYSETGDILGWVSHTGCENASCLTAIADGRPYHAIPRVGILPDYHFATFADANDALDRHNNGADR